MTDKKTKLNKESIANARWGYPSQCKKHIERFSKKDIIIPDDSKFIFLPVTIEGEEWEETDLENGMLICSSK